jgi:lipoprotein-releasing system permease protein
VIMASSDVFTSGPLPVRMGRTLLGRLSGHRGDQLIMQFVVAGRSRSITTVVDEVFSTGFPDIDEHLVLTDLASLRRRVSGLATASLEIRLVDPQQAEAYKLRLSQVIKGPSYLSSWQENNPDYFAALRWQKLSLAVVFSLILGVGAFEVASSLVVMVTEKRRELGVLSAMGADRKLILKVLVLAGGVLGCMGVAIGAVGGVFVVVLLNTLGIPHFPPEIASIYKLDRIPLTLLPTDLLLVLVLGAGEVLLASLLPARRASRREPVEVLRWV